MVNYSYLQSRLGHWVECHSGYGVHRGILHQVRPDGIILAIPRGGAARYAGGNGEELRVEHALGGTSADVDQVQFFRRRFFNPFFFFIPFFLLSTLFFI
jgi:hypothetical protein